MMVHASIDLALTGTHLQAHVEGGLVEPAAGLEGWCDSNSINRHALALLSRHYLKPCKLRMQLMHFACP